MSVLTKTEAKSISGRLFLGGVIFALSIGAISMVYPFVLMFSGSIRSEMDGTDMSAIPLFLKNGDELARKFLESKYDYDVTKMNTYRGQQDFSFRQASLPSSIHAQRIQDMERFVDDVDVPDHWWSLGGTKVYKKIASANSTRFVQRLQARYDNDLYALAQDLGAPIPKWRYVSAGIFQWEDPRMNYEPSPFYEEYFALLKERPLAERTLASLSGWYRQNIIYPNYGKSGVAEYNKAHVRPLARFEDFAVSRTAPELDQPQYRKEWAEFVQGTLNVAFIRTEAPDALYQGFLSEKYGQIESLNERWASAYTSFEDIALPADTAYITARERPDYTEFLKAQSLDTLYLVGPEMAWQDWLKAKYGSLAAANEAHERAATAWSGFPIPTDELELNHVRKHGREIKWEAATRNYRNVFSEIFFQGRSLINTLIFVTLSLFFSLTLQPLAAYSLSRFNPPGAWRIILLFMATMAFPPMVGMIPQFLILRKLHLMNTFVALVLPTIVNGYLIFLLKGFFDSLPKSLYEAALIDGASEFRMFTTITMSLSKPILAVVALGTFNGAWVAFMGPLLVCPKEEMHVLAIWLYQFQKGAPMPAVFASILITSIPSLLIFLFTQRTIMRGIAVPSEK